MLHVAVLRATSIGVGKRRFESSMLSVLYPD